MNHHEWKVNVRFENGIEMDFKKAQRILSAFSQMSKENAEVILEDLFWNRFSITQIYGLRLFGLEIKDIQPLIISLHSDTEFSLSPIESVSINGMTFDWATVLRKVEWLDRLGFESLSQIDTVVEGTIVSWLLSVRKKSFNPFN